jgi:hypothetical protein
MIVRGSGVPLLFGAMERTFGVDVEPISTLQSAISDLAQCFQQIARSGLTEIGVP